MESQQQQPQSDTTASPETMTAAARASLSKLPPAPGSNDQQIGTQISVFLAQLPDYVGRVFNESLQPIISLAVIVAGLIGLRVVLTILISLNDIPLLAPTFELIGIGYSAWFVYRYLLKASTRQDLFQELQKFLNK